MSKLISVLRVFVLEQVENCMINYIMHIASCTVCGGDGYMYICGGSGFVVILYYMLYTIILDVLLQVLAR